VQHVRADPSDRAAACSHPASKFVAFSAKYPPSVESDVSADLPTVIITSARARALSKDWQPEDGHQVSRSGQLIMPVGAMAATGPRPRPGIAVASSTSGRIEVTRAAPGQEYSHGMTTCEVLPCRGAASASTESSAEAASGIPDGIARPTRTPTSSTRIRCPARLGRTTGPRAMTACSDSAIRSCARDAKPRGMRRLVDCRTMTAAAAVSQVTARNAAIANPGRPGRSGRTAAGQACRGSARCSGSASVACMAAGKLTDGHRPRNIKAANWPVSQVAAPVTTATATRPSSRKSAGPSARPGRV
jgi:hypothetical protein